MCVEAAFVLASPDRSWPRETPQKLLSGIFSSEEFHNSGGLARGSRSLAVAVVGRVEQGRASGDGGLVNMRSGISVGRPSKGNDFVDGKNGCRVQRGNA